MQHHLEGFPHTTICHKEYTEKVLYRDCCFLGIVLMLPHRLLVWLHSKTLHCSCLVLFSYSWQKRE